MPTLNPQPTFYQPKGSLKEAQFIETAIITSTCMSTSISISPLKETFKGTPVLYPYFLLLIYSPVTCALGGAGNLQCPQETRGRPLLPRRGAGLGMLG